jgi:hypothetical protein
MSFAAIPSATGFIKNLMRQRARESEWTTTGLKRRIMPLEEEIGQCREPDQQRIDELICLHGKTMNENCQNNDELRRIFADTVLALGRIRDLERDNHALTIRELYS